jgi:hypothetical protein
MEVHAQTSSHAVGVSASCQSSHRLLGSLIPKMSTVPPCLSIQLRRKPFPLQGTGTVPHHFAFSRSRTGIRRYGQPLRCQYRLRWRARRRCARRRRPHGGRGAVNSFLPAGACHLRRRPTMTYEVDLKASWPYRLAGAEFGAVYAVQGAACPSARCILLRPT